jgi:hypothetical protein
MKIMSNFLKILMFFFMINPSTIEAQVRFEQEPIRRHVRELISRSEQISAQNQQLLQAAGQDPHLFAHAGAQVNEVRQIETQRQAGELCQGSFDLNSLLQASINRHCNIIGISQSCDDSVLLAGNNRLRGQIQQTNSALQEKSQRLNIDSARPHSTVETLIRDRALIFDRRQTLYAYLNELYEVRNNCRTQAAELFSSECGRSYRNTFNDFVVTNIAARCTPEIINQYTDSFISYMEEDYQSPVQILQQVQNSYTEVRRTEMEAAGLINRLDHFIAELDRFIDSLQSPTRNSPLVERSPRPARNPARIAGE